MLTRKVKVDYLIAVIFLTMAILSIIGRITIVSRIENNYESHVTKLENNFRDLYLSVSLRNFSHSLNIYSIYELLDENFDENERFELNRKNYFETLSALKKSPLLKSPEDQAELDNLYQLQIDKLNYIQELKKNKIKMNSAVFDPELEKKNIVLRDALELLISKEVLNYRIIKLSLTESHDDVVSGNIVISLILFFIVLFSAYYIFKFARNLRKAHQKTLEAVKSRDDILAVVSHDLKNPLSSINLNAQIVKKKLDASEKGNDLVLGRMDAVLRSVEVMKSLIQDLLDQAKLEEGKLELEIQEENFKEILNETETVMESTYLEKSIQIENQLPSEPTIVKGDKKRIMQILTNLISNAVKFSETGGKIEISAEKQGTDLKVSIQDHGKGISEKELPYVFDRFWQAKETAKKGTGLGLSIVKNLVSAHGGKVWVESKLGEGTTFTFTLPLS